MKVKIPYLQWRDGRPRWEPGPLLRQAGHKGRDLKDAEGHWLNMADAMAEAERINEATKNPAPKARSPKLAPGVPTLDTAWLSYTATPEYRDEKAPKTRHDYANKAKVFLAWAGDMPVSDITKKLIKAFWRTLYDTRGHAMANGVVAVLRIVLEHCVEEEWIGGNPAAKLKLMKVQERVVTYTPEETALMVETADELGEFGVGDGIHLALATGQRQGDVLAMNEKVVEGGRIRNLRQGKTGAVVAFPQSAALQRRLALMRARHADAKVKHHRIVIDDRTGMPFDQNAFKHRHKFVRDAAVAKLVALQKHEAAKELAGKTFLDYRDTALTRLYLAGMTVLEIAALSGHEPATVHKTLKHYIALNLADGERAIAALDAYMLANGITV